MSNLLTFRCKKTTIKHLTAAVVGPPFHKKQKIMNGYGTKMVRHRRPFWLPASNYYVLAAAIAVAAFFLIWGVLHDGGEEVPWVTAGIAACIILAGAVFCREFILRRARERFLADQRRLDRSLKGVAFHNSVDSPNKLTLERNSALLHEIKLKSDAAKILGKLSDGHKEVFEMCGRYLSVNGRELAKVNPGSPRLAVLLKSKDIAEDFHKFHLLQWAEIEARNLTNEAKHRSKVTEKIEAAQKALTVIDSALGSYPNEQSLRESGDALIEFIASIKLGDWIERAEKAAFKNNFKLAKKLYGDALFFLGREDATFENKDILAEKLRLEFERVEHLEAESRK